jgi:DNA-binding NtrC family response regulator
MSSAGRILVVDDDAAQREMLAGFLRDLGSEVLTAEDGPRALDETRRHNPDVVITDLRMPGMDGHQLLKEILGLNPDIRTILVTAYGTVQGAVACLKDGAFDYLLKPLELEEVEHAVRRALEERHLRRENRELRMRLGRIESLPGIVTAGGKQMARVLSTVARVAPSAVSVLLLGESGTGKELLARAIHAASPRSAGRFVAVNAAALSPTLLESELFGHERGAFTGAERTRRAVERVGSNRAIGVDVRVVAATHSDLPTEVAAGRFREDLYYRLAVVTIEVPPLRRRRADIPALIEHFVAKHAPAAGVAEKTFSREAVDLLVRYDFPGNVRELENIVQRCLVLARGDRVSGDELPTPVRTAVTGRPVPDDESAQSLPARVAALEQEAIEEALRAEEGNQSRAATRLGISERALRYKLAKYRDG